ncbi:hypothetical protein [Sulfurimonas xiamenensis]|jgi:hypothetical protein|uniref:Uncharacterized protein n=1 Tax=Sulfurimonas xiamenensis TaxID=2590021 RepID=A0AAJ4A4W9_9BACT|nr:hypothetical protein [Sulfurimonas xiamenensis]QFR43964.1 hypothetical protein FJR47_08560 [Sulfurimonas xiamenensis]
MPISRELALKILKYLLDNSSFYFPFKIVCINFDEDDELYDVEVSQEMLDEVLNNDEFKDFKLVENLQHLDLQTLQLMSKGFIEKIVYADALKQIEIAAKEYRNLWKIDICESVEIEEYGFNEFVGGKAEGFEESLKILNEHLFVFKKS